MFGLKTGVVGRQRKIGMFKSLAKRRVLPLDLSAEVTGDSSFEIVLQLFLNFKMQAEEMEW